MKNITTMLLLFIAIAASAQRGHHNEDDLSAEQQATLHTKKMTLALVLDDSQSTKVYKILLDEVKKRKARHNERKSQDKSKLTKEERFARENDRLDSKIAIQNEMKIILSEEQFKLWHKLNHEKHRRGRRSDHRNGRKK